MVMEQDGSDNDNCVFSHKGAVMELFATFSNAFYFDWGSFSTRLVQAEPAGWDNNFHVLAAYHETDTNSTIEVDGVIQKQQARNTTLLSTTDTLYLGRLGLSGFGASYSTIYFSEAVCTKTISDVPTIISDLLTKYAI